MLNGLQFVLAHVTDLASARAFYAEKLGLTVAAEQPGFVQFAANATQSHRILQAS